MIDVDNCRMLRQWLEGGTADQKLTAANRLSLPDGADCPEMPPPPGPRAVPGMSPARPAYPTLRQQARNLAGSLVRWVQSGCGISTAAEARRRKAICVSCPSGLYDPIRKRCTQCGCKTAVKPWLKSESCPRGHW